MGELGEAAPEPLSHLGFALRNAVDVDAVVAAVLQDLAALPGVSRVGLALTEGGGRRLRFRASDAQAWCHIDAYDDVPLTAVARTGRPVLGGVDDFGGRFAGMLERQRAAGVRAVAAVPLPGPVGPIGGLVVFFDADQPFTPAQRRMLDTAGRRTAEAVLRVRSAAHGPVSAPDDGTAESETATLLLDDDPRAARTARRFLRARLEEWGIGGDAADSAELCLSELVTNAVVHAGTTSVLTVRRDGDQLVVEVRDRGGRGESPSLLDDDDPLEVFGRGLQLVDALSDRWGTAQDDAGTTSWFALDVSGADRSEERTG